MSQIKDKSQTPQLKKNINQKKLQNKLNEKNKQTDNMSDGSDSDIELFDNQYQLELNDPKKRVKVSTFKGKVLIHIREYYEKDGKWLPGTKGTTMTPQQWNFLKDHIHKIDKAIQKLK